MKRVLFVDGSNLYGGMTDLLKPGEYFDFSELLKIIEEDMVFSKVMFYATYMRDDLHKSKASQRRAKAQKSFLDSAKNNPKVIFYEGHFSGGGKEKGVDVRLAVDMVYGAAMKEYEEAAIMTGDADLTYAVEMVRKIGLPAHLIALGSRFPFAISFKANRRLVYDYRHHFENEVLLKYRNKPRYLCIKDITEKIGIKRPDA